MFIERAKTIFANLGLATIARNKLKTSNPSRVRAGEGPEWH